MARTAIEIQADLDALTAARRKLLTGERVTKVNAAEGGVEYGAITLAELNREIVRLEMELARAEGRPSPVGPVRMRVGTF